VLVVVLGGVSLSGGIGGMGGVLGATALIGILANGMTILDLSNQMQSLIKGTVLLAAVVIDNLLHPRDEQTSRQGDI
jgi:ribose transport system permease protein